MSTPRSPLRPSGKPARALRALAEDHHYPMSEVEMWKACEDTHGTHGAWHGALSTLVAHGFAVRSGRPNMARWAITDAGREALAALDAKTTPPPTEGTCMMAAAPNPRST